MNKMKNFSTVVFHLSNSILLIFYLYPGSILGCFLFNDCSIQPQITRDFIISSNHFYVFTIFSALGILVYRNTRKIKFLILYLFLISIILELFHLIIPNRAFEISDLFGNITGVLFIIIIYKVKSKYV